MHRNKLLRRVLALALVFCMVLTTIPAAFAAENSQFTDVNANHWAYPYIQDVVPRSSSREPAPIDLHQKGP